MSTDRLDKQLRTLTGYRMRRAGMPLLSMVNAALEPFGLRRPTFSALMVIAENPGLRQSQLAKTLSVERPNLVQIIDELEAAGLVERQSAPEDRRAYALCPTAQGNRTIRAAYERVRAVEDHMTRGLTPAETAALHRALQVIEDNVEDAESPFDAPVSRP